MTTTNLAIYGGGPLGAESLAANLDDLRGSGFTTVILWSFHVAANGDLAFNDTQGVVSGGVYGGAASWPAQVAALKAPGSSVTSVWASVGAGGVSDFTHVAALIAQEGIGPDSILYRNFAALRAAFTVDGVCAIDGIDFDDEDLLDVDVLVQFATLLFGLGFQITFCPYNAPSIWVKALATLANAGHLVSWFNLQAYAGGFGNDPRQWIDAVATVVGTERAAQFIVPGLWCYHGQSDEDSRCPSSVQSQFASYQAAGDGLSGGFLWLYDDVLRFQHDNPCATPATTAGYAAAIAAGLASASQPARPPRTAAAQRAADAVTSADVAAPPIDHVVMLMLENRGFDSVLGLLYGPGEAPSHLVPAGGPGFQGLLTGDHPVQHAVRDGRTISASPAYGVRGANSPGKDPGEPYAHVNQQLFRSTAPPYAGQRPTMDGFLQDYCDVLGSSASDEQCKQLMHMFSPADLPALSALARTYATSDAWFCSVPTQTNANRAFSICGTSLGEVDNGYYPAGTRGWVFECDKFDTPTIWNVLADHQVSWAVYYNQPYPPIRPFTAPYTWLAFPRVQTIPDAWAHFKKIDQFMTDARNGALPAFSYLEPAWGGETKLGYVDGNDYHPPVDVTHSEEMLREIYRALRENQAAWERTLLVVVFDEHGGTYDHVPPPWGATPPWGADPNPKLPKPRQYGFNFDRFGVRVPCLLVSPWIEAGTVVRSPTAVPFDHTSILASVLDWKRIDRSTVLGARVAGAPTFWHALTRQRPRTDDQAFPTPHGPALGAPVNYGSRFRLLHLPSGRMVSSVSKGVRYWFPTLGTTGVELSFRGGYGAVTSRSTVMLRTAEAAVNAPGVMDKPANTLGAWRDEHDCYYVASDAYQPYQQQQWAVVKVGARPGSPLRYGDEVQLLCLYPDFLGQVLMSDGSYLTTASGARDAWRILPMP